MNNNTTAEILETIKSANNILINMDTRTDYDALSSSKVFGKFIRETLGKNVTIIHANKTGIKFEGLFEHTEIQKETDISSLDLNIYDLIIFLDSGGSNHVSINPDFKIPNNITTINIDHHSNNDMFGQLNYVDQVGSCCTVLHKFFSEINQILTKEDLDILAVGLCTDTGFFTYDSCKAEDFKFAAFLTENGVIISNIFNTLNGKEYLDQIKYKQIIYNNLKINNEKQYAYITLKDEDIKKANIDMSKVFVRHSDLIKNIVDINFVFVIAEVIKDKKYYEVSFRTKNPNVNVKDMAEKLGGGGHNSAAGAQLFDINTLEDALNKVLTTLDL